ncbi:MAG: hypothetical protein IKN81_00130 [Oscillospiraceae bacterium]|nr:hypothetical protein [Oscillospiraceae bacterium]
MSKSTKKSKNQTRQKKLQITPVAAVYEDGNVQVLVEDKDAEGLLRPLTPQEKDLHYPKLDKQKPKKVAKRLGLSEDDIIRYDEFEADKKALSELKAAVKKKGNRRKVSKRIRSFFEVLNASSDSRSLITILFAALIAQFTTFLPKAASTIRAIYFEDDAMRFGRGSRTD